MKNRIKSLTWLVLCFITISIWYGVYKLVT